MSGLRPLPPDYVYHFLTLLVVAVAFIYVEELPLLLHQVAGALQLAEVVQQLLVVLRGSHSHHWLVVGLVHACAFHFLQDRVILLQRTIHKFALPSTYWFLLSHCSCWTALIMFLMLWSCRISHHLVELWAMLILYLFLLIIVGWWQTKWSQSNSERLILSHKRLKLANINSW